MHIALLSPSLHEKNGIADYAEKFRCGLEQAGLTISCPLTEISGTTDLESGMQQTDWKQFDVIHAELGGGRIREFIAADWVTTHYPEIPFTATIHDPERIVWRDPCPPALLKTLAEKNALSEKLITLLLSRHTLKAEKKLAQAARKLICLTSIGAQGLQRRMNISTDKVTVIPHGVPDIPTHPFPPADPIRLLYFGFIYHGKGIEDILEAIVQLPPSMRQRIRLSIAGGTLPATAFKNRHSYLEQIKLKISKMQLESLVSWHTDLPENALPELIQSHHVMVLPYHESKKIRLLGRMYNASGALAWALACGRGVIVSDTRALSEEISNDNGTIFKSGDIAQLTHCIMQLISTPSLITRWGNQAVTEAGKRHWRITADKFKHLFKAL